MAGHAKPDDPGVTSFVPPEYVERFVHPESTIVDVRYFEACTGCGATVFFDDELAHTVHVHVKRP